jgi:hypothetical protein
VSMDGHKCVMNKICHWMERRVSLDIFNKKNPGQEELKRFPYLSPPAAVSPPLRVAWSKNTEVAGPTKRTLLPDVFLRTPSNYSNLAHTEHRHPLT